MSTDDDGSGESGVGVELYREYWGWTDQDHNRCIVLCLNPGQRKPVRCPTCYGKAGVRPMSEAPDIEPERGRGERFWGWVGRCLGELAHGLAHPFRLGREHHEAMIRDILQDAIGQALEGWTAELVRGCPSCEAMAANSGTEMTAEVV